MLAVKEVAKASVAGARCLACASLTIRHRTASNVENFEKLCIILHCAMEDVDNIVKYWVNAMPFAKGTFAITLDALLYPSFDSFRRDTK
ncbi:hypothetical protein ALC57_18900 [Trachymyrmex cornetzi]|uniref:Uncharacterized protein n=1 Tax=Trachymyrmex cornetzi TaxID=471704 RepID=A0A195D947_9HYME|nr:hypothetical protein ALC57_18900 [Trachymyrmex cornetzi]